MKPSLPNEILFTILKDLTIRDRKAVAQTCSQWRQAAGEKPKPEFIITKDAFESVSLDATIGSLNGQTPLLCASLHPLRDWNIHGSRCAIKVESNIFGRQSYDIVMDGHRISTLRASDEPRHPNWDRTCYKEGLLGLNISDDRTHGLIRMQLLSNWCHNPPQWADIILNLKTRETVFVTHAIKNSRSPSIWTDLNRETTVASRLDTLEIHHWGHSPPTTFVLPISSQQRWWISGSVVFAETDSGKINAYGLTSGKKIITIPKNPQGPVKSLDVIDGRLFAKNDSLWSYSRILKQWFPESDTDAGTKSIHHQLAIKQASTQMRSFDRQTMSLREPLQKKTHADITKEASSLHLQTNHIETITAAVTSASEVTVEKVSAPKKIQLLFVQAYGNALSFLKMTSNLFSKLIIWPHRLTAILKHEVFITAQKWKAEENELSWWIYHQYFEGTVSDQELTRCKNQPLSPLVLVKRIHTLNLTVSDLTHRGIFYDYPWLTDRRAKILISRLDILSNQNPSRRILFDSFYV